MKIRSKKAITLLEVMIALALASVLFSSLFYVYRQVVIKTVEVQKIKEKIAPRQKTFLRLSQLFSEIINEEEGSEKIFPFHLSKLPESASSVLLFSYRKEADPDPLYAGLMEGALYLNWQKELCLVTWPSRKEVLLPKVERLVFNFFDPEEGIWKTDWLKEEKRLPPMVRLYLYLDEKYQVPSSGTTLLDASKVLIWDFFPPGAAQEVVRQKKS